MCIYKWFDWTSLNLLYTYNRKQVSLWLIIWPVILFFFFKLLKSANILRQFCWYFSQTWATLQTFTSLTSSCADAGRIRAQQKQSNWLVCDRINSNITVVSTDISMPGHDIWSRHKCDLTGMTSWWWVLQICSQLRSMDTVIHDLLATQKPL